MTQRLRNGTRVIAATGLNRDHLVHGRIERLSPSAEIAEVRLDSGKLLAWPLEWIYREDGSDA